jgi:hypothetical protein
LKLVKNSVNILIGYSLILIILIIFIQKILKIKFLQQIPTKRQIQLEIINDHFSKENKVVTDLDEFIDIIKKMPDQEFKEIIREESISLWLKKIYNNKKLAYKIEKLLPKTRKKILKTLEDALNKK